MIRKVMKKTLVAAIALSVTAAGWLTPVMPSAGKAYAEATAVAGDTGIISTYAGGPAVGKSTEVAQAPFSVLTTEDYIYVVDVDNYVVRRIDKDTLHEVIVAGNGTQGGSGDGGPATSAQLGNPRGIAIDSKGNLFIADYPTGIRKVNVETSIISTVDVKVDDHSIIQPQALAIDKNDTLYIAAGKRIIRSDDQGNGSLLANGMMDPIGLAIDYNTAGEPIVYVSDVLDWKLESPESRVCMIDSTGAVTTVIHSDSLVTELPSFLPYGLDVDNDHNLYIADMYENLILKVNEDQKIDKVDTGDVKLVSPVDVFVEGNGDLYVADMGNYLIRKKDAATGSFITVGGNGKGQYSGDGGLALNAQFFYPKGLAVDSAGNVFIADTNNNRIRKVDAVTGIVTTIAGTGAYGYNGDDKPAIEANLSEPIGIAVDGSSNVYIIDDSGQRIRKVDAASKQISTVADVDGASGIYLDGKGSLYISYKDGIGRLDTDTGDVDLVYTREVDVDFLSGFAVDSKGKVYFTDINSPQGIFQIDENGDVSVYATDFNWPRGLVFDKDDNLYVADSANAIVRKVYASGEIATAFGIMESPGYSGDGGPANEALLHYPTAIAIDDLSGDIYIADSDNSNIRKVDMPGTPAAALNATAAPGSASGTTSVTAAVYEGHQLVVKVSSSSIPTPSVGDTAPKGTGVIAPYVSGTNIGDVNASTNKYVGVYELNPYGRVVAFKEITLTATQINGSSSPGSGWVGGGTPPTNGPKSLTIVVDGKELGEIAKVEQTETNGKTMLTVTLDKDKLVQQLAKAGQKPVIAIPLVSAADKVSVLLNGEAAMALGAKQATLEIRTPNGNYSLPLAEMIIDDQAKKLVEHAKPADLTLQVEIAKSDPDIVKLLETAAATESFQIAAPPVDYTVVVMYNGKPIVADKFASFVKREIPLANGANTMTTAIILDRDGTFRHVPTKKIIREGKTYAVVSSLSNSTYAVVTHTVSFADVEGHWSKEAVNDLASRFVISGADEERFNPNAAITRAEFAALIVRALGLSDKGSSTEFKDVQAGQWFAGAVGKAQEYAIISGYEDGTFRPTKTITRAEAMVMLARAMELAGMETSVGSSEADTILSEFKDGAAVDGWAVQAVAAAVKSGLVSGSKAGLLPASNITRAETASMLQRLLKQAKLID